MKSDKDDLENREKNGDDQKTATSVCSHILRRKLFVGGHALSPVSRSAKSVTLSKWRWIEGKGQLQLSLDLEHL